MNWISVKDRLPDPDKDIIALTSCNDIIVGYLDEDKIFHNENYRTTEDIRYWQEIIYPTK